MSRFLWFTVYYQYHLFPYISMKILSTCSSPKDWLICAACQHSTGHYVP